jgi:uncharacterized damage-inducible protein DinB
MRSIVVVSLSLIATPLAAQTGAVAGLGTVYNVAKGYVTKAAEQMDEANYSFKATPEVRSFGQLLGHIANANYMFCSMVLGEKSPSTTDFEKTTAKAALVQGIKDSFTYCDKAYAISDAEGVKDVTLFGMKTNKIGVLSFNSAHDMEHYGNLVTYFRLKGIVPPSSQRGM